MTQPPTPQPGQPFDPNQIPTDPQQAAAWAQQQQAAAWQQHAAWQQQAAQQAAQEAQEEAHQEYLEQQAAAAKGPAFGGVRGIISLVVGLVVVGASAFGIWKHFQTTQSLKAGNCIIIEGKDNDNVEPKTVECGKEDFSWKVTSVESSQNACAADTYTGITFGQKGRRARPADQKFACLVPLFKEGKCYVEEPTTVNGFSVGSCATGEIKVNKVIEDASAVCEVPEQTHNMPSVNLTYCLEEVA
ncbi:hypothetical protein [Arachnia propionica]|uniref:Uncharacterized protein n=1 Tax=Arachnia propionica TaxID=1750 RepID=A0A3P1WVK6_9ACTN|nr:hypothetical protein [Arachnia propionica]RRD50056.1 hypothetical protein EII35_05715 [Arachnia propionica]